MKEPIVQTVIKGNGFIYEISNPQTEALFLKTFRSVPRCPTVPRPMSRDSGTGRDSAIINDKRKEADYEQLFVTEI